MHMAPVYAGIVGTNQFLNELYLKQDRKILLNAINLEADVLNSTNFNLFESSKTRLLFVHPCTHMHISCMAFCRSLMVG